MNKSISFFFRGALLAITLFLAWGIVSALLTADRYSLTTTHPGISNEKLKVTLKHGQIKAHFVSRAIKSRRVISYDMHGVFLRFGPHYVLFTTDDSDDVKARDLAVRKLFINKISDNQAFLISDRRGSFKMRDGSVIYLNSVFTGTYR
ncbi:hypothetical protein B6A42_06145 [Vibrio coralliilyticus]|uniref:hypothetical protein n=1 Tax=Vibrio coralliilyticus TaxID=190893 RepID=UPI00035C5F22|nr:hypothetical protein [Vibrio coralliilyticus]ARC91767.1 hypothetical protein B6A42_06145 [Vibrio coralliilyticus]